MAYPIWSTPAGNLGIVPEEEYYKIDLLATDEAGGTIEYFFLSGMLPPGIQVAKSGRLEGVPVNTAGPDQNQTYTFTIRAQNLSDGNIADRTFYLTVTNIAPPIIIPRNVNLGLFFDGDVIDLQLEAVEFIPGANLTWSLKSGTLPPGLALSSTGVLSGYLEPIPVTTGLSSLPNWDETPWDDLSWQFPLGTTTKQFNFSIQVYDGVSYDVSNYIITVIPKNSLTADSTSITADITTVDGVKLSVDTLPKHFPIILTTQSGFPTERQGSWFAQQIQAIDLDGDTLQYNLPDLAITAFDASSGTSAQTFVAQNAISGAIAVGAGTNGLPIYTNNTSIQVLYPYLNPSTSTSSLEWFNATVNSNTSIILTGNTIITASAGPGVFITQAANGANANVNSVSATTGTMTIGGGVLTGTITATGNLITANIGDTITQYNTTGNATITTAASNTDVLYVQYNSGAFTIGNHNLVLQINGSNIASYPVASASSEVFTKFFANIGDTISQPSTGATATVILGQGDTNTLLHNPYELGLQYTSGNFTIGSGNLAINGSNIAAYPISVICNTTILASYNTAGVFNTKASVPAYISGVNTNSYPRIIANIGVTINSVSPNNTGNVSFDTSLFDQDSLSLPGTLSIDAASGWITGYLPIEIANETTYDFTVNVAKLEYPSYSSSQLYTLTVLGSLNNTVEWLTPSNLGSIENGAVSDLYVTALSSQDKPIYYELYEGTGTDNSRYFPTINLNGFASNATVAGITYTENWVRGISEVSISYPAATYPNTWVSNPDTIPYQKLPQGLELQPDGLISGRVSFELFSLDMALNGIGDLTNTTFDNNSTTFDHVYTFTVNAITADQTASATQTFTLTVEELNLKPYENLYLKAYMSQYQRSQILDLLNDQTIFPSEMIYRVTDPYFGLAKDIKSLFLAGLNPSPLSLYAEAVSTNHFGKRLLFGDIKTAIARIPGVYDVIQNSTGNVIGTYNQNIGLFIPTDFSLGYTVANTLPSGTSTTEEHIKYEVVYVEVLDENSNASGQGPRDLIDLSGIISTPYYDQNGNTFVLATPNSFSNMTDAISNTIGYANKGAYPDWMTSPQADGTQLGFTRAVVLAYTQPNTSATIAWRLQQQGIDLNQYDFTVDSYLLDNIYSADYDISANAFITSHETTFDRYPPLGSALSNIGTVDYAVNTSFETINEKNMSDIIAIGGLDGVAEFTNGQLLVFYKQEFPMGASATDRYNSGWANNTAPWDLESTESWDEQEWDQSNYVTGYQEWLAYNIPNQRIGIWQINIDANNYVTLTFVQTVLENQALFVRYGITHGGTNIYYDPTPKTGNLYPSYSIFPQQIKTVNTEFDGNGTLFYDYRDSYVVPEQGDTQIVFPKTNVFD